MKINYDIRLVEDAQLPAMAVAERMIASYKEESLRRAKWAAVEIAAETLRQAAYVITGDWDGASRTTRALALHGLSHRGYTMLANGELPKDAPRRTAEQVREYVAARRAIRGLTKPGDLAAACRRLYAATWAVHEQMRRSR